MKNNMIGGTEAAKIAGVSRDMLLYFSKNGRGPEGAMKVAGRWVYDRDKLKGWKPQPADRGRPRKGQK